ncbi:CHASE2 domain-containing protein [Castellaniella sp. GW247-6E4]|uniref:CHASE2 domain-containing protein n=1 Tax=Castellaniella sp. GW247-6E4 TaxID=3140380 RepID=UPI0033151775
MAGTRYPSGLRRRLRAEWLSLTLALSLLAILLSLWSDAPGIREINRLSYDLGMQAVAHPAASRDIAIIAIDDASIETLGYWPWRRSIHAALLEHLGQARAVGLDLILSEPHPTRPGGDAILAQAIARHGRVVLPIVLDPTGEHRIAPLPELVRAAAAVGRIDAQPDPDGTLRWIELRRTPAQGGPPMPHFALELARIGGNHAATRRAEAIAPDAASYIQFADPDHGYALYPYAAVLSGQISDEVFRDRIVLIGAWASGLGDRLPTAIGGGLMAGVEILANSLQNLQGGSWIRLAPPLVLALAALLPVLPVCLGLRVLSPRWSLASALAALAVFLALDALLMQWARYWLPPAGPVIALLLAYPLWSWRCQEASLGHIDTELERLRIPLHDEPQSSGQSGPDTLPERAVRLHRAISRLEQAAKAQEETLGFISHDMRSPQSSILATIELRRQAPLKWSETDALAHIEQQAHATLRLVDQFVQLARAESAVLNIRPCILQDLIQDCCDRRWPRAAQRGIDLRFDGGEREAVLAIDMDLMARALGNLLDNAILYSSSGGAIDCGLTFDERFWHIHVQDTGPGIAPDQIEHLFTPFWRASAGADKPAGSGLGLAFAQTVAARHGGYIRCQSQPGAGSRFTISLPGQPAHPASPAMHS